jgi:hypothetical protein
MTNQPPPIPNAPAQPKKGWRWWQVLLAIVAGLLLLLKLAGTGSIPLEVRLLDRGIALTATNIGNGPITITDVIINDRRECKKKGSPQTLQIGEQYTYLSYGLGCNIVRVTFETDKGSSTFTFNGR